MTLCAVCGRVIGGRNGRDNVSVIRHVRLIDGRSGWVALHVRCAGYPLPSAAERTVMPPGQPLTLPMLEGGEDDRPGMA